MKGIRLTDDCDWVGGGVRPCRRPDHETAFDAATGQWYHGPRIEVVMKVGDAGIDATISRHTLPTLRGDNRRLDSLYESRALARLLESNSLAARVFVDALKWEAKNG